MSQTSVLTHLNSTSNYSFLELGDKRVTGRRRVQESKYFGRVQKDYRTGSIQTEVLLASTVL